MSGSQTIEERAHRAAYLAKYRASHPTALAKHYAYMAEYRERHRDSLRAYARAYAASHHEERAEADARHRGGSVCDHEACLTTGARELAWLTNEHVCYLCGTVVWKGVNLHMDHVVPASRGGLHCAENLRPACAGCNQRKHAKLLPPAAQDGLLN